MQASRILHRARNCFSPREPTTFVCRQHIDFSSGVNGHSRYDGDRQSDLCPVNSAPFRNRNSGPLSDRLASGTDPSFKLNQCPAPGRFDFSRTRLAALLNRRSRDQSPHQPVDSATGFWTLGIWNPVRRDMLSDVQAELARMPPVGQTGCTTKTRLVSYVPLAVTIGCPLPACSPVATRRSFLGGNLRRSRFPADFTKLRDVRCSGCPRKNTLPQMVGSEGLQRDGCTNHKEFSLMPSPIPSTCAGLARARAPRIPYLIRIPYADFLWLKETIFDLNHNRSRGTTTTSTCSAPGSPRTPASQ